MLYKLLNLAYNKFNKDFYIRNLFHLFHFSFIKLAFNSLKRHALKRGSWHCASPRRAVSQAILGRGSFFDRPASAGCCGAGEFLKWKTFLGNSFKLFQNSLEKGLKSLNPTWIPLNRCIQSTDLGLDEQLSEGVEGCQGRLGIPSWNRIRFEA